MRIVRGYTAEGAAIWSENQPSYARVPSHGGSLVVGGPGWKDKDHKARLRKARKDAQEKPE